MRNIVLIFITFCFCTAVMGKTSIAFFKIYRRDGSLLQLEEGGTYAHVAISLGSQWIHSHPTRGVEIINKIEDVGYKKYSLTYLQNNTYIVTQEMVRKYLSLPYDRKFEWSNKAIYCSELVAKILDVKPNPMSFDSRIWGNDHQGRGDLGISPDEVFKEALKLGFKE